MAYKNIKIEVRHVDKDGGELVVTGFDPVSQSYFRSVEKVGRKGRRQAATQAIRAANKHHDEHLKAIEAEEKAMSRPQDVE
jgi:hypothetical protein